MFKVNTYMHTQYFNPIQSQAFYQLFHTDNSVLVGAPTGSGKTVTCEMAILRLLATRPKKKVFSFISLWISVVRRKCHNFFVYYRLSTSLLLRLWQGRDYMTGSKRWKKNYRLFMSMFQS